MKERFEDNANCAVENADAKAPLSSYLRRDNHSAPSEGWTIFSSEDQTKQTRTPDLSVLKQIKNFLNAKSDESSAIFDSNSQNFRVDYPYYASDSETEPSSTGDDLASRPPSSDAEESEDEETRSVTLNSREMNDVETDESTHEEPPALSQDANEEADESTAPSSTQKSAFDCVLIPEDEKDVRISEESDVPLNSLSPLKDKCDSNVPSVGSQQILKEVPRQQSQSSSPYRIDVAEILGSDFSHNWEPALCGRIEEENETLETAIEAPTSPQEHASTKVVTSDERRNPTRLTIAYPAQFSASRRRDSKDKLSIFHRFVDLVTAHKQAPTNVDDITQNNNFDDDVEDDSREICICAPYESANSVEVVVAPCYVGANLTFQNQ